MKTVCSIVAGVLAVAAFAPAQVQQELHVQQEVIAIQRSGMVGAPGSEPVLAGMIGADGRMGLLNVPGKPFSATEVRRTVQVLASGARIETSDSNLLYRDEQGRTRVEQTVDGKTTIVIMDPVARFVAVVDRTGKTVHKNPIPPGAVSGDVSLTNGKVTVRLGATSEKVLEMHSSAAAGLHPPAAAPRVVRLELGLKDVNGVMAQGTRETRTIPVGAIGNDRELQIVDERWFSADLQLLIRSENSDPRFGETNYQLTNIARAPQDPALFQIPGDYAVTENTHLNLPEMKPGK